MLRESTTAYIAHFDPEKDGLSLENTICFDINVENQHVSLVRPCLPV